MIRKMLENAWTATFGNDEETQAVSRVLAQKAHARLVLLLEDAEGRGDDEAAAVLRESWQIVPVTHNGHRYGVYAHLAHPPAPATT